METESISELFNKSAEDFNKAVSERVEDSEEKKPVEKITEENFAEEIERKSLNAAEIFEITEVALGDESLEISKILLKKSLREINNNLGNAAKLEKGAFSLSEASADEDNPNKPQVWYRQVEKISRKYGGENEVTNEVVAITRMNNAENKEESTVVIALVKQEDGAVKLEEGDPGTFITITEAKYEEIMAMDARELRDQPKRQLIQKLINGEVQLNQYNKTFKEVMGTTPKKYWEGRDNKLKNSPDRWVKKEAIKPFIENLEFDYHKLLQEARVAQQKVIEDVGANIESRKIKIKESEEELGLSDTEAIFFPAIKVIKKAIAEDDRETAKMWASFLLDCDFPKKDLFKLLGSINLEDI